MIFSMIWGFFMIIYRALTGFSERPAIESYVFQVLNMYFLVSLCAMQTHEYLVKPAAPRVLITVVGIFVLYSYLMGRLERTKFVLQFNNNRVSTMRINTAWESFVVLASIVYFSFAITRPELLNNSVNNWFYSAVKDIYATPIIGWLFMIVGFLFLIVNLVKSVFVTAAVINWIIEKVSGNRPGNNNPNSGGDNDEFTDYEVVEDDKLN